MSIDRVEIYSRYSLIAVIVTKLGAVVLETLLHALGIYWLGFIFAMINLFVSELIKPLFVAWVIMLIGKIVCNLVLKGGSK